MLLLSPSVRPSCILNSAKTLFAEPSANKISSCSDSSKPLPASPPKLIPSSPNVSRGREGRDFVEQKKKNSGEVGSGIEISDNYCLWCSAYYIFIFLTTASAIPAHTHAHWACALDWTLAAHSQEVSFQQSLHQPPAPCLLQLLLPLESPWVVET
jgi:hypothetical protein